MSSSSRSQNRGDVACVFQRLAGQHRWTGVAYDANGSVLATASSGTRAATRSALDRALAGFMDRPSDDPRSQDGTRGGSAPGIRRRDPARRGPARSLAHAS